MSGNLPLGAKREDPNASETEPEPVKVTYRAAQKVEAPEPDQPEPEPAAAAPKAVETEQKTEEEIKEVATGITRVISFWNDSSWQKKVLLAVTGLQFIIGVVTIGSGGFALALFGLVELVVAGLSK